MACTAAQGKYTGRPVLELTLWPITMQAPHASERAERLPRSGAWIDEI